MLVKIRMRSSASREGEEGGGAGRGRVHGAGCAVSECAGRNRVEMGQYVRWANRGFCDCREC